MNHLDSELRRLIKWARAAGDERPAGAPFGLAGRLASRWRDAADPGEPAWWAGLQRAAALFSLTIVTAGIVFWTTQLHRSAGTYDFTPAYQLIAQNVAP